MEKNNILPEALCFVLRFDGWQRGCKKPYLIKNKAMENPKMTMCWFYFLEVRKYFHYFFTLSPVWLVLCGDDAGTMKEQMPLISCHYSSVASHKHIPVSSHGQSQVQRYHLPAMYMTECVSVCGRVINRKIKDKI